MAQPSHRKDSWLLFCPDAFLLTLGELSPRWFWLQVPLAGNLFTNYWVICRHVNKAKLVASTLFIFHCTNNRFLLVYDVEMPQSLFCCQSQMPIVNEPYWPIPILFFVLFCYSGWSQRRPRVFVSTQITGVPYFSFKVVTKKVMSLQLCIRLSTFI